MLIETLILVFGILAFILVSNLCMNGLWKVFKITNTENNLFLTTFYNSLLFSLLIVTMSSVIATKGKTIFIFNILILIAFYIFNNRSKNIEIQNSTNFKISNKTMYISVILLSIFSVITSYYFIIPFSLRNDVAHYTKIGECLINQGIENPYHYYNLENNIFVGNIPYHYFEMWFGSVMFKINSFLGNNVFSNYLLYMYFVFNLFRTIVLVGVFGLISKFVKFNWIYFLIILPFFIIEIAAYCNWGNDGYVAQSNFFKRPNFIFYYLFLIPIFDGILNKNRISMVVWSIVFILSTITALPAVFASIMCLLIYDWFKLKNERKQIVKIASCFLFSLVLIAVFYKLFGVSKEASTVETMGISEIISKTISLWKACVFMFTMLLFKISLFIIIIFLFIWNRLSKNTNLENIFLKLLIFVFLLCLTGIGLFQLVPYLDNMYQFAFIGYCAVFLLLMIVIAVKVLMLNTLKKIILVSTTILFVYFGYQRNIIFDHILLSEVNWNINLKTNFLLQHGLPEDYIQALETNSAQLKLSNGASIIGEEDAIEEFVGLRHSATYQLGNYLMVFNNNVNLPLLSNPDALYPDKDTTSKDYYKAKNFNRKTLFYKNYNKSISYHQNLNNYTQEHDIKFVFASKNVNPYQFIDSLSIIKIVKDSNKGHQLIMFESGKK